MTTHQEKLCSDIVSSPHWHWVHGMLTECGYRIYSVTENQIDGSQKGVHTRILSRRWPFEPGGPLACSKVGAMPVPDFSDPLTLAGLLEVVREAYGDPRMYIGTAPYGQGRFIARWGGSGQMVHPPKHFSRTSLDELARVLLLAPSKPETVTMEESNDTMTEAEAIKDSGKVCEWAVSRLDRENSNRVETYCATRAEIARNHLADDGSHVNIFKHHASLAVNGSRSVMTEHKFKVGETARVVSLSTGHIMLVEIVITGAQSVTAKSSLGKNISFHRSATTHGLITTWILSTHGGAVLMPASLDQQAAMVRAAVVRDIAAAATVVDRALADGLSELTAKEVIRLRKHMDRASGVIGDGR